MSVFFSINDLANAIQNAPQPTNTTHRFGRDHKSPETHIPALVPVHTSPSTCDCHRDDVLTLASTPRLLDMNTPGGVAGLAMLMDEIPLYRINMELLMDDALTIRHHDNVVATALANAFADHALPNTLHRADTVDVAIMTAEGSLRHPMLGHLDAVTLAKIYMNFYRDLPLPITPERHARFNFAHHILGRHPEPFHTLFDGFIIGPIGMVRADILLGFGIRDDFDPQRQLDYYIDAGHSRARTITKNDFRELFWAWMEADDYQSRRCRDMDTVSSLALTTRQPNWLKADVFHCLEHEAMKQTLSQRMIAINPDLSGIGIHTRTAIAHNANDGVDELIQSLLSEQMDETAPRTNTARAIHEQCRIRKQEPVNL